MPFDLALDRSTVAIALMAVLAVLWLLIPDDEG